jgi:3-hydroxybutyryl-CoA dehydrogenase
MRPSSEVATERCHVKENRMQQQTPVVVVGAGTMGTSLARLLAARARPVTVLDIDGGRLAQCREALAAGEVLAGPVSFAQDWPSVGEASVAIESVTEDLALKRRVLAEAERHLPATALIMTNTSGLSIDALGEDLAHPERFVGAHFFNPADLIPAVEVVPGQLTHDATVAQACQLLRQLGKRPAVLKRCVPGFVANRIQHALMRECLSLLEQGVVEPQALDDIVRYSIGLRRSLYK